MNVKKYTFLFNGKAWFLKIDDLDTLNEYHKMVWDIRMENFQDDLRREREGMHPSSDMGNICYTLAKAQGINSFAAFRRLEETQHRQMSHHIIEGKALYVNSAGGYTLSLENIQNRYDADGLRWPVFHESDIRIKQWPGGTHYYAYIGPVQVKCGNVVKWASESDARMAAKTYVTTEQKMK